MWSLFQNCVLQLTHNVFPQYHRRLFVLDTQIAHLDTVTIVNFAAWMARQYDSALKKKRKAENALVEYGIEEKELEKEWNAQIEHQTRKAPGKWLDSFPKMIS